MEQEMYSRHLATVWEPFKFPSHMRWVEPGNGVFMFAKGVGIIGIGRALERCEILSSAGPNRLWYKEDNFPEWRIPTKWLAWKDDADACPYPTAPNFTFWDVTAVVSHESISTMMHASPTPYTGTEASAHAATAGHAVGREG